MLGRVCWWPPTWVQLAVLAAPSFCRQNYYTRRGLTDCAKNLFFAEVRVTCATLGVRFDEWNAPESGTSALPEQGYLTSARSLHLLARFFQKDAVPTARGAGGFQPRWYHTYFSLLNTPRLRGTHHKNQFKAGTNRRWLCVQNIAKRVGWSKKDRNNHAVKHDFIQEATQICHGDRFWSKFFYVLPKSSSLHKFAYANSKVNRTA